MSDIIKPLMLDETGKAIAEAQTRIVEALTQSEMTQTRIAEINAAAEQAAAQAANQAAAQAAEQAAAQAAEQATELAKAEIQAKTDEQAARIPEVTAMAANVHALTDAVFLYNEKTVTLQQGEYAAGYMNADGTMGEHTLFLTTGYHKVVQGSVITYEKLRAPAEGYVLIACYDDKKNYLQDASVMGTSGDMVNGTWTVPGSVRYVRFVFYIYTNAAVTYLEETSHLDAIRKSVQAVQDKLGEGQYTKTYSNWSAFAWNTGKFMKDGLLTDYATGLYSDFVDAKRIHSITYRLYQIGTCDMFACYDENKVYLPDKSVKADGEYGLFSVNEGTFVPPEGVAYIRIGRFTNFTYDENQTIVINVDFVDDYAETKAQLPTQWQGKKWFAFGTSITDTRNADGIDGTATGKYPPYLEQLSGLVCANHGISGATIGKNGLYGGGGDILTEIKATDISDADLITIEGFVNDYACAIAIGAMGDTSDETMYGALGQAVQYCLQNSNATIVLLTEHTGRVFELSTGKVDYTIMRKNALGLTQDDYNSVTRNVARLYGVHCIDAGAESQINQYNPQYFADHLHHSELGGKQYAETIWDRLKQIHCNADVSIGA